MGEAIELKKSPQKAKLLAEVEAAGVSIRSCYQCGKCTAGCPVAFAMDYGPRTIVRFLQLGMTEEALNSHSIWLCAACETCSARCPRSVEPAKMMDALKIVAGQRGQHRRTQHQAVQRQLPKPGPKIRPGTRTRTGNDLQPKIHAALQRRPDGPQHVKQREDASITPPHQRHRGLKTHLQEKRRG